MVSSAKNPKMVNSSDKKRHCLNTMVLPDLSRIAIELLKKNPANTRFRRILVWLE
jgi:hypothetical protein